METDGTLSVLLKPENKVPTAGELQVQLPDNGMPTVIISDGKVVETDFKECNMTPEKMKKLIQKKHIDVKNVLLMTMDKKGNTHMIKKVNGK